ncbi:hypothetical protein QCA50_012996 [Cerrena zonata]|uniref:Methyltransferase type 11 domain-containing protein n=1 Tax=Cerrena zonata TaxID=2478898 RepID=A0AAW0FYU5_9APHY
MATFSKTGFKTLNYNSFRPHYPASFYQILQNYVVNGDKSRVFPIDKAIDLGCGSGVASYPLLNFSKEVIGLDLSPLMIETANSLKAARLEEMGIENQESINLAIELESVDLITAAQCIHWFDDHELFFRKAYKLLKPGGVLAYWYYIDPVITDFSNGQTIDADSKAEILRKLDDLYHKYVYQDPKLMGPHWEQPGRDILKHELESVNAKIPRDLYVDIQRSKFRPSTDSVPKEQDLDIVKSNTDLKAFENYIGTYSGYHNYKQATGDPHNLIESLMREMESLIGDRSTTRIDLTFNTGYVFMRKASQ